MSEALLLIGDPAAAGTIGGIFRIRAGNVPVYTTGPDAETIACELRRMKEAGVRRIMAQPLASYLDRDLYERIVRETRAALGEPDLKLETCPDPGSTDGSPAVELLEPLFSNGGASEQVVDRARERVASMRRYRAVSPNDIQLLSFDMISRSLDLVGFPAHPGRRQVVVRAVHATADFSLAQRFHFSLDAVRRGKEALRDPLRPVITDVNMVAAGIGRQFSDRVLCWVAEPEAARLARETGLTRSAAAMELLSDRLDGALVAVGNAPTALVQLLRIMERDGVCPGLIVGVPVGLVGAAESKEQLIASGAPCIALRGNRGGSTVASAVVNALGSLT